MKTLFKKLLTVITTILLTIVLIGSIVIKDIQTTESGAMITFKDNTGYYFEY